jgi:hypothetical protein
LFWTDREGRVVQSNAKVYRELMDGGYVAIGVRSLSGAIPAEAEGYVLTPKGKFGANFEDQIDALLAERAETEGSLGVDESRAFLDEIMGRTP